MIEFRITDTFYITGKGYVFFIQLPREFNEQMFVNDTIWFDDDDNYTITQIERTRNLFNLEFSQNVGILIRGDLKHDESNYNGKKFSIIKQ
jgi:hypothetical protein